MLYPKNEWQIRDQCIKMYKINMIWNIFQGPKPEKP